MVCGGDADLPRSRPADNGGGGKGAQSVLLIVVSGVRFAPGDISPRKIPWGWLSKTVMDLACVIHSQCESVEMKPLPICCEREKDVNRLLPSSWKRKTTDSVPQAPLRCFPLLESSLLPVPQHRQCRLPVLLLLGMSLLGQMLQNRVRRKIRLNNG